MKKFSLTSLFLILLIIASLAVQAQPLKKFSVSSEQFLGELTEMFDKAQTKEMKDRGKVLMEEFADMWMQNKFSQEEKDSVYTMCNIMLSRKMKTFPNFEEYLNAAIFYSKSDQSEESFNTWCYALRKLSQHTNHIRFMALLEGTNSLLGKNVLTQSQIMTWKSSNRDFTFKYDSLPYFEFPALDLTCVKKGDSTCIYDTRGRFYPTLNLWKGRMGKVYWDRAGFANDEVFAEIHKAYSVTLTKSEYQIDTVTFYNKKFFDRPLYGSLEEKVIADLSEERVSYPRFTSFYNRLQILDIFKDIDYAGGFAMYGAKLMGKGTAEEDAYISLKKNNKVFVRLGAKMFIIRPDMISAERSSVTIYLAKDSIYHPGLKMKYDNEKRELSLIRDNIGISKSPYYNTYHKVDMYFEALYWKLDEPKIDFTYLKGSGSESTALFESDNYYSEFRWEKLKGMEDIHPLLQLKQIGDEVGGKVFTDKVVQAKMRISETQAKSLLMTFSEKGFIIYDIDNGIVVLKDRLYNYINAKSGKTDYDVIQFNSVIAAQNNATLNLLNNDLKIRGVALIHLSDSQNVYILPTEQEIILKKNRDFEFDGFIHAGLFDFYGKKFRFNYDKFMISMPMVDSMSFKVQDRTTPTDMYGHHQLVRVRTAIENLDGELLIDHQNNKSGLKSFPTFPTFLSKKDAYVYYDKPFIFDKVYSRDKFYFRVAPFRFDSLDNYNSEAKSFAGYLVSAGIFPDIYEPLRVQPDFSLGFIYKTPAAGLPAYGGKGKYDSIVDLSYKGLLGKGNLKYLTSTTRSNDIIFFPDSMYAQAHHFTIAEKAVTTEYPAVYSEDVEVKWYPYWDKMKIRQKSKPFDLFAGKAILNGGLELGSKALTSYGTMIFSKVEMFSNRYLLKHHSFLSDSADVKFKTASLDAIVLQTNNFNVNVDFNKQIGKFKPNEEETRIYLPFNNYSCQRYNFDWLLDKDRLEFHSLVKAEFPDLKVREKKDIIGLDFSESGFLSEHPAQDSLYFYAPDASYNLGDNTIHAKDVPVILVADAAIFPDSGKVTVLKKAEMTTFYNAGIIANTESKSHSLYDCRLDITSRKFYTGSGYYDYVDELDKRQKVYLSTIRVDSAGSTFGTGSVAEQDPLMLSPFFSFTGKLTLYADREFMNFDGGTRIKHDCDTLQRKWLRFTADINPKRVAIPIGEKPLEYVRGERGRPLGTGLYIGNDSTIIYPAFIQNTVRYNDAPVITAQGFLTYDKASQKYTIAPEVDSSARYLKAANVVVLDKKNCQVSGSGQINMGANFGQMQMISYGSAINNMVSRATEFDLAITLDFMFDDESFKVFTGSVENEGSLEAVDVTADKYYDALRFILGPEKAEEVLAQLNLSGRIKNIPNELKFKFFIADVKLKWNSKSQSFVSDGDIGIATLGNVQIFRYVPGYIEISKKRSGSILNMYFELGNDWYYFNYTQGKLQTCSSRKDYNDLVKKAMDADKNVLKVEAGQAPYAFIISTTVRKDAFLKKIGADGGGDNGSDE